MSKATHQLILHFDEHNRVDYLIGVLMQECQHDLIQADQCLNIGKASGSVQIKIGDFDAMYSLLDALHVKKLNVTIEPLTISA